MTEPHELDDTPGPDATPEQEAFVAGLLASLGPDDIPMPDDVVARLDAVLAQERRTSAVAAGSAAAASLSDAGTDLPGVAPLAPVTVLPTQRRGPSLRAFQWVGGLAAAALVVVGGAAVLNGAGLTSGDSSTSGSAASAPEVAAQDSLTRDTAKVLADTGTAYTTAGLATQAAALVSTIETRTASGYSPQSGGVAGDPGTPASGGTDPGSSPSPTGGVYVAPVPLALSAATLPGCVQQLTGGKVTLAIAVDHGTFDGKPADIVVLPALDDAASYDVWVLVPGCSLTEATPLTVRRIPIP